MQFRWMAGQENVSEQQLELGKDVFSHSPSSTFFLKGLCLTLCENMMERVAKAAELLQICGLTRTVML